MAQIKYDTEENSLDNSAEDEILGMVDEGSFGSGEDKPAIVSQSFLDVDVGDDESPASYNFRELSGGVTYRFVHMGSGDDSTVNTITTDSSNSVTGNQFYVISNPVQMFNNPATPKKVLQQNTKAVVTKKRDDKRRATHNEVERRRRDKINNWITKLAALIPNSGLPDSASKGGILEKACDYITELTEKGTRYNKIERENDELVVEVLKLNEQLNELRKENASLKSQIADNCIVQVQKQKFQKS